MTKSRVCLLVSALSALFLISCGGSSDSSAPTFTVGGVVSGLPSGEFVNLLDNGVDSKSVSANGPFTFQTALASGTAYAVAIAKQPTGATCTITGASGTISSNVNSVTVTCTTAMYTVGGTLSGLTAGTTLALQNNAGDDLSVTANGTFTFAKSLATGAAYSVSILTQPNGAVCTVTNGTGTIAAANVSSVAVSCASSATTGSTAISALSIGNSRIALVPLNLFDSTTSSNGVALVAIDGTTTLKGALVATSFPIQACSADSANLVAVCIDYSGSSIAILSFRKFASSLTISDVAEVEYASGVPTSTTAFSGGACLICGVVAVPSLQSFILSAFDGYHVYAYPASGVSPGSALTPSKVYSVPIAENFTLSIANNWLISPDYDPTGESSRPLRVIDLVKQQAYTWTAFTDACPTTNPPIACTNFASQPVDAEAIDDTTGLLIMNNEEGNSQLTVDLSQANFDATASTFTAPSAFTDYSTLQSQAAVEMSGILVSSVNHWGFTVAEFGDATIGVAQLPAAGGSGGTFTSPPANPVYLNLSALTNFAPCTAAPVGGEDPHAQGYTLNSAGVPLGLLVSGDSTCVALVNFAILAKAPLQAAPNANVVDLSSYDPVTAGAVTFYSVSTTSGAGSAAARKAKVEIRGRPLNPR